MDIPRRLPHPVGRVNSGGERQLLGVILIHRLGPLLMGDTRNAEEWACGKAGAARHASDPAGAASPTGGG